MNWIYFKGCKFELGGCKKSQGVALVNYRIKIIVFCHYRTNASILRYWGFFIIFRQFKSLRIAAIHQKREILYQSYSPNIECSNIALLNVSIFDYKISVKCGIIYNTKRGV